MSEKVELTEAERQWILRPPTGDEAAAIRRMPRNVAEGWLRRKRAQELHKRRQLENLAEGMEFIAKAAREAADGAPR